MAESQPSNEEWRPVVGHEGHYEVSNQGRVRSLDRVIKYRDGRSYLRAGAVMKWTRSNGYHYTVRLSKHGRSKNVYVHQLVAEAHIRPRQSGEYVLHANDDPADNRVSNLRFGTQVDNMSDLVSNGKHPWAKRTHCSHGHEYTPENTYPMPGGGRKCRECKRREGRERARRIRKQSSK